MKISQAKSILWAASIANDSVLFEGLHGIGKSEVAAQFCKENDFNFEPLFLSTQEVGDLIGIPKTVEIDGELITTWSKPIWLQRIEKFAAQGIPSLLFLDELNRAPIDVRQSALPLVLEGKLHEHSLPIINGKKTLIAGAVNPTDDYQVDELDPALLDRFLCVYLEVDPKGWLAWALENKKNPIICDWISENPLKLHWTPKDGGIGSTPRSLTKLGDYLDNADKIPDEIILEAILGKLGSKIGSQFHSFYINHNNVVKMEDIEKIVHDNKSKTDNIEEIGDLVTALMEKTEAIQKSVMCDQMADKYIKQDDILPFLVYLYSLEVEICTAFLHKLHADNDPGYKKIARIDGELNDKKLFGRILDASERQ